MEHTSSLPVVVVGVDGSRGSAGAIRWAVSEARLRGGLVRLVHVVPSFVLMSALEPLSPAEFAAAGTEILTSAEREVADSAPDVQLATELRFGNRAVELAEAARDAQLMVVGRDARSLAGRLVLANTCTGTAARSMCPTVSVSQGWPAAQHDTVLVGVKSPHHAPELLEDAFEEARRRQARLVALHAWKLPGYYDDIVESRVAVDEWSARAATELETILEGFRQRFPDVGVTARVVHDHPSHALVEASRTADLLVVVRRAHGIPAGFHLGGTARAVLKGAHCPVWVVPPRTRGASWSLGPDHSERG